MYRWTMMALAALAAPAAAEVTMAEGGFTTENSLTVAASPAEVWGALVEPERWWNAAHSWSGDAANISLEPVAGGCFCETLAESGSVEHQRVILVQPGRMLRLSGALGPLQSEALTGTMSWELTETDGGTRIAQTYVVGGYIRFPAEQIAPAVDGVVREQLERLAALFEPAS